MKFIGIIGLFALAGCNALAEFPTEPSQALDMSDPFDAAREVGVSTDVRDPDMEDSDLDDVADMAETCPERSIPTAPEFSLSGTTGAPFQAPLTEHGFGIETVEHGGHLDYYVAWTLGDDVELRRIHGDGRIEEIELTDVASPDIQDLALGRTADDLLLSVQRSDCIQSGSDTFDQVFFTLPLSEPSNFDRQAHESPCPLGTARISTSAFSGVYNDYLDRHLGPLRWVWAVEPLGMRSTREPEDAFSSAMGTTRVESAVTYNRDRDSRIYSSSGRLVLFTGDFEGGDFSMRWWDTTTTSPPQELEFVARSRVTGFVHLRDEIYATAFSDLASNRVDIRLFEYDPGQETLTRIQSTPLILFDDDESAVLQLAAFPGGLVVSEWISGAEEFTARMTPIDIVLDEGTATLAPRETARWSTSVRAVRRLSTEAMRQNCDLVVANLSLFGQTGSARLDLETFRFPGYFAP